MKSLIVCFALGMPLSLIAAAAAPPGRPPAQPRPSAAADAPPAVPAPGSDEPAVAPAPMPPAPAAPSAKSVRSDNAPAPAEAKRSTAGVELVKGVTPISKSADELGLNEAFAPDAGGKTLQPAPYAPPTQVAMDTPRLREQPSPGAIWVPGYWDYNTRINRYVYVFGGWRNPPEGMTWHPGRWVRQGDGWVRLRGFWSRRATEPRAIPGLPPAVSDSPDMATLPGPGHVWAASYSRPAAEGKFETVPGRWVKPPVGQTWINAHYVWRPEGWLYVPGYFDYRIGSRGTAWAPYVPTKVCTAGSEAPVVDALISLALVSDPLRGTSAVYPTPGLERRPRGECPEALPVSASDDRYRPVAAEMQRHYQLAVVALIAGNFELALTEMRIAGDRANDLRLRSPLICLRDRMMKFRSDVGIGAGQSRLNADLDAIEAELTRISAHIQTDTAAGHLAQARVFAQAGRPIAATLEVQAVLDSLIGEALDFPMPALVAGIRGGYFAATRQTNVTYQIDSAVANMTIALSGSGGGDAFFGSLAFAQLNRAQGLLQQAIGAFDNGRPTEAAAMINSSLQLVRQVERMTNELAVKEQLSVLGDRLQAVRQPIPSQFEGFATRLEVVNVRSELAKLSHRPLGALPPTNVIEALRAPLADPHNGTPYNNWQWNNGTPVRNW